MLMSRRLTNERGGSIVAYHKQPCADLKKVLGSEQLIALHQVRELWVSPHVVKYATRLCDDPPYHFRLGFHRNHVH